MQTRKTICMAAVMVMAISTCYASSQQASEVWHNWRRAQEKFPLAAWAYFMRFDGHFEEYKTYADANFTIVTIPQDLYHYNNATKAGLNVLIGGWQQLHHYPEVLEELLSFPTPYASNVIGYQLKDEPEPQLFEALARVHKTIYEKDKRNVLPITDLLPGWAWMKNTRRAERAQMNYDEFLAKWIKTASPPVIINCHYAPMLDGTDREDMYADKELMRKHALLNDIGYMTFISAAQYRDWYRYPSESDYYWQVYTCLAYGSQGVWYWNWRIKPQEGVFYNGLVDYQTGEPANGYHYVKNINAEVLDIGDILMKLRSRNVWHTGDTVPPGTTRFVPMPDSGSSVIEDFITDEFIIGEFDNQDDPADKDTYVMLVNKRHGADMKSSDPSLQATAVFKPLNYYGFIYLYEQSDNPVLLEPVSYEGIAGYYELDFEGGKGKLLRFSRTPLEFTPIKHQLQADFARRVPIIDGKSDDFIWQQSQNLQLEIPSDRTEQLNDKGNAKIAWRDNQLWIMAEFEDNDIVALGDKDGQEHYKLGDCLEIFIKPEFSDWYWEIWINPKGNYTTLFWEKKGVKGDYTFELKTATQINGNLNDTSSPDTGWSVEAELPFSGLLQEGKLMARGKWTVLIARQNYGSDMDIQTRELSSYPKLSRSNFHLVDEYIKLDMILRQ